MQLDRLQAVMRRRSSWEAMDLGLAMARTWARPLWTAWLVVMTPTVALIWAVLWQHPGWALLLCWWLKPLWGHAALHVLSRRLFGEEPTLRETLRATWTLVRQDLPGKLLWRRLLPWRTAVAPVLQLEGLRGAQARRRRGVLVGTLAGPTALMVLLSMAMEGVVAVGAASTLLFFLPDEPRFEVTVLFEQIIAGDAPWWVGAMVPVTAWTLLATIEPLIVAAGFGLYLNRRTLLEGWDVELTFRRLAERMGDARKALPTAVAVVLLALGATAVPAAHAQQVLASDDAVEATLDEVLANPDFGSTRTVRHWELRPTFEGTLVADALAWLEQLLEQLSPVESNQPDVSLPLFGSLTEGVLWLVFGALLVGALLAIVANVRFRRPRAQEDAPLAAIAGQTAQMAAPEVPTDDPVALARTLWQRGQADAALGVLYAASVAWLIDERGVAVPEGATEGEVLRLARKRLETTNTAHFAAITRGWQTVAYAHEPLTQAEFEAACAAWPALRGAG